MTSVQTFTRTEASGPAPRNLRNASIAGVCAYLTSDVITNSDL